MEVLNTLSDRVESEGTITPTSQSIAQSCKQCIRNAYLFVCLCLSLFVCLFLLGLSSHSKFFHSYGEHYR